MQCCAVWVAMLLTCVCARATAQGSVSGTVQEKGTGEVIVGANVLVQGTRLGAATNRYGHFSVAGLDTGSYVLRVSAIGYTTRLVPVHIGAADAAPRLRIELESAAVQQKEVLVEAERRGAADAPASAIDMPVAQILRLPSLGGEADVFRALQLLPGVKAVSEISSGLYVRGGSPDQNLVLLDRMILYNPSHLAGFLSTFNADAVNHVRLIKGALPAEYGGRLSSVVDVTMREGSQERFRGAGGVSMIDARLTLEGPAGADATWMVSGRRVYLDALVGLMSNEALPYYFYDLLAKTNVRLGERDRVYFSGFFGRDVLGGGSDEDFESSWGNSAGNLRWTHLVSNTLFTDVSAVVSDYRFSTEVREGEEEPFKAVSGILDMALRGEAEWTPGGAHVFKAGIEATRHAFTSEATTVFDDFTRLGDRLPRRVGTELSLYAQDTWTLTPALRGDLGARLFYFDRDGVVRAEPRLSLEYAFEGDGTRLSAAVMGANQFLHLVSRNDLALPTDMWFPTTHSIRPAWGMQYVLGAARPVYGGMFDVSIELYYKSMDNLLEFRDDARFSLLAPIEDELTAGSGEAYGMELFVQKKLGDLTGWIGYTLAWTERTFPDLNDGEPFPPRYDRRHDISVVANYRLAESWEFTATWVYGTGQAFTFPVAIYSLGSYDYVRFLYSSRNGYRLPAYHRLDLNFSHVFTWLGWNWKASFNVYNAYNRMNPFSQSIEREYNGDGSITTRVKQQTLFPILPTLGISFEF